MIEPYNKYEFLSPLQMCNYNGLGNLRQNQLPT